VLKVPYIVQEFLEGESLQEHLVRQPKQAMGPRAALGLLLPVMEALAEAHRVGITHRDLKPANLFLVRDRDGVIYPKVIDFGVAKVRAESEAGLLDPTSTGVAMGTPAFMAPEQARGDSTLDARADVWALGVMLYELVSRRRPYEASNTNQLIGMVLYEEPTPLEQRIPSLPPPLCALVRGALQRDREKRYPTMQAFLDAARACLAALPPDPPGVIVVKARDLRTTLDGSGGGGSQSALSWSSSRSTTDTHRRSKKIALASAGALVILVGLGAWFATRSAPTETAVAPVTPRPRPAPPAATETVAAPTLAPSPDAPAPPTTAPAVASPAMTEATACMGGTSTHANNACVIRVLRSRASTDQEIALLASTYGAEGRSREARRTMQTYLQRYPQGPMAGAFRAALEREHTRRSSGSTTASNGRLSPD
jgi:serine/threonine-protein kinase